MDIRKKDQRDHSGTKGRNRKKEHTEYFERITSEGLAHFSYIIGNGGKAVVIDPRRDWDVYIEKTIRKGMKVTHILETHRSEGELEQEGRIPGPNHIHMTQLPNRMSAVPKDYPVYIFCGSGLHSMTAASYLKQHDWEQISIILGGFADWNSITCPIQKQEK